MGFMNWLMNGVGFETEEVYDDSVERQKIQEEKFEKRKENYRRKSEAKARKAQARADKVAKKYALKQEKDYPQPEEPEPKQEEIPTSYNPSLSNFGTNSTNVGGYGSNNVEFVYPTSFDDVTSVIEILKRGESIMLNLNQMSDYESQRLLDCTSGAAFALNGNIINVNSNIYLVTPEGFNIRVPQNNAPQNQNPQG